jgi:hypothetical protein
MQPEPHPFHGPLGSEGFSLPKPGRIVRNQIESAALQNAASAALQSQKPPLLKLN